MAPFPPTLGVILAGGLARRMGGIDKPLLRLQGQTLLVHVVNRLSPQCECLILNANGDGSRFAGIGLPVVSDTASGHPGPLAGVLAGLEWAARNKPSVQWIVSVPGDTPFIPVNLVERLHAARSPSQSAIACAASGSREHYATGLWAVSLRHNLQEALTIRGIRRVEDWAKSHGLATATWPIEPMDPFFNINTHEDLAAAAAMLGDTRVGSRRLGNAGCSNQEDEND